MALSGSFTTSSVSGFGCTIYTTFSWTGVQSIENNTTKISWTLTSTVSPSGYHRGIREIKITLGGVSDPIYLRTYDYDNMLQGYNGTQLASGSYTVSHENDGTKSVTFNVYINVGNQTHDSYNSTKTNQSFTLDTIPRASTMSLSPTSGYTNGTFSYSITRAVASFSHTITTTYNSVSYTLRTIAANGSVSGSFTIPTGIRTAMKNASVSSATLTLVLTTSNSGTTVGTKQYSLSIVAPVAQISIPDNTSVACTANVSFSLTNIDTSLCTYTVQRWYGSSLVYSAEQPTTRSTMSFTKPNASFEPVIINEPSGTVTIKATTLIGSSELGSVSKTYTVTIPTSYGPTLRLASGGGIATTQSYGTSPNVINYLAGYSGFTASFTVGKTGSAPITVSASLSPSSAGTTSISSSGSTRTITVNKLAASETDYTVTLTVKVKDTRGREVTNNTQIATVSGYAKPSLSGSVVRAKSDGTVDGQGQYANVSVTGSAFNKTGNANNAKIFVTNVTVKYGTNNAATISNTSGTTPKTLTASASHYGGSFDIGTQYTFAATVTDSMGFSSTSNFYLPKAAINISLHKQNGVGLGTTAERGYITTGIPFKGTVTVSDSTASSTLDGGSIFAGTSSTRRLTGATNGVETTAGKIFFYAGVEGTGTSASRGIAIGAPATAANRIVEVSTSNEVSFKGTATTAVQAAMAIKLGSTSVGNSSKPIYINGGTATRVDVPASGSWFKGVPQVGSDGVMEIGAYIDFHATNTTTADYDVRLQADGTRLLCSKEFRPESLTKLYYGTYYPRRWCYGVSTRSSNDSITAGYYMYVPMNTTTAENPVIASGGTKLFGSASGGIKVFRAGKYKVSGAIYMGTGSNGRAGAYIFKSTAAFSTAGTRVRSPPSTSQEMVKMVMYGNGTDIVASVSPKVLTLAANDIIHLVARPVTSNGTVYYTNNSTYLLVEWLSD